MSEPIIPRKVLREAHRAAAENMPHDDAVEHVARAHGLAPEAVHEALQAEVA